ncbi:MAG: putative toxin-antitoxin system toxin component, PIN family [Burkholderiales bacterium]|nr:putative toxin-antitoxin system toxin component, PIN family [Burkholderiales bacterium]
MAPERVVIDTNVFLTGLLSAISTPARAVERAIRQDQVLASRETLRELAAKLLSPKFDRYVARARRVALLDRLAPNLIVVEIVQRIRACRDPKDDAFLELAVNGSANLIVTGDRDLLSLHPFRGIDILSPSVYLERAG